MGPINLGEQRLGHPRTIQPGRTSQELLQNALDARLGRRAKDLPEPRVQAIHSEHDFGAYNKVKVIGERSKGKPCSLRQRSEQVSSTSLLDSGL